MQERVAAAFGVNVFVNRESGVICRVRKVDASFAYIEMLSPQSDSGGTWLAQTTYSMPIAEYDERFAEMWRPATAADLVGFDDEGYRPPKVTASDW